MNPSRLQRLLVTLLALCLVSGCARFGTGQFDSRKYERFSETTGKLIEREETKVTTKAGTSTIFDSDSALANFKATQTEKTQSASVGSLSQSTSGTNAVEALRELKDILIKLGL